MATKPELNIAEYGKDISSTQYNDNFDKLNDYIEAISEELMLKVNTINVKGKEKRVGRNVGKTSDWKKAIVSIDTNPSDKTYLAKGGKTTKVATNYKTSIDEFMGA